MHYEVAKPFQLTPGGDVLEVGSTVVIRDAAHARDLARNGLVWEKAILAAPRNKDAAPLRKIK